MESTNSDWLITYDSLTFEQKIGVGYFGEVYRGEFWGTDVAIKKILKGLDKDDQVLGDLRKEAAILSSLRHPNVVLFMGLVEAPEVCIVTEFCHRGSLFDLLHSHEMIMDFKTMMKVGLGIAKGMTYLHCLSRKIIHRDLKSHNVLIGEDWTAKICDFGISHVRKLVSESSANTKAGHYGVIGTPEWMAPEILQGEAYDESADVYSYGIVLTEVLSRQMPYRDRYEINGYMDVVDAVLDDHAMPTIPDWCPTFLSSIIRKCLDRTPTDRPTFPELMQLFSNILKDDPRSSWFGKYDIPRLKQMLSGTRTVDHILGTQELGLVQGTSASKSLTKDDYQYFVSRLTELLGYWNPPLQTAVCHTLCEILANTRSSDEFMDMIIEGSGHLELQTAVETYQDTEDETELELVEKARVLLSTLKPKLDSMEAQANAEYEQQQQQGQAEEEEKHTNHANHVYEQTPRPPQPRPPQPRPPQPPPTQTPRPPQPPPTQSRRPPQPPPTQSRRPPPPPPISVTSNQPPPPTVTYDQGGGSTNGADHRRRSSSRRSIPKNAVPLLAEVFNDSLATNGNVCLHCGNEQQTSHKRVSINSACLTCGEAFHHKFKQHVEDCAKVRRRKSESLSFGREQYQKSTPPTFDPSIENQNEIARLQNDIRRLFHTQKQEVERNNADSAIQIQYEINRAKAKLAALKAKQNAPATTPPAGTPEVDRCVTIREEVFNLQNMVRRKTYAQGKEIELNNAEKALKLQLDIDKANKQLSVLHTEQAELPPPVGLQEEIPAMSPQMDVNRLKSIETALTQGGLEALKNSSLLDNRIRKFNTIKRKKHRRERTRERSRLVLTHQKSGVSRVVLSIEDHPEYNKELVRQAKEENVMIVTVKTVKAAIDFLENNYDYSQGSDEFRVMTCLARDSESFFKRKKGGADVIKKLRKKGYKGPILVYAPASSKARHQLSKNGIVIHKENIFISESFDRTLDFVTFSDDL